MNREETTKLTRYVKAACPQQAIDDYTPDVWFDFLRDLDPGDCLQAVQAIIGRQPFVAVAEIVAEVRRIRDGRLRNSDLALPAADPSDARLYTDALRDITKRIADGKTPPFKAIGGPASRPPAEPNADIEAVRDDLAQRRHDRIRARSPRPDATGPVCQCGTLLDPDGTCFTCSSQAETGAS